MTGAAGGRQRPARGRWIRRVLVASLLLASAPVVATWLLLKASLPPVDGQILQPTLSAPVSIGRDAAGVPTVRARNRRDLAFATGFVHGQDRYFQMDLARRSAAGELAALFGGAALELDRSVRLHRFRARAEAVVSASGPAELAALQAYADGVNAGLGSLAVRPFEYLMLGQAPVAWRPADTVLVLYAMFLQLNDSTGRRDLERGFVYRHLPRSVYDALYPLGTEWDAPLAGGRAPARRLPSPREYDLRAIDTARRQPRRVPVAEPEPEVVPGSNNWAVAGASTADGRGLVANDMHLGLDVPNTFYRACLVHEADAVYLCGVTLPGTPALVAGSNGHIAWGFTNSYGDWTDLVSLQQGSVPGTYRIDGGDREYREFEEIIQVADDEPVTLVVRETDWGPVIPGITPDDGEYALVWTAHRPAAVNLGLMRLEGVQTVEEALPLAALAGIPPQNFTVADAGGNIGWTIAGRIPRRVGDFDSRRPADWSLPGSGWAGWVAPDEYPRIRNPRAGRIWTANARVVDGTAYRLIGPGDYDLGARAGQIRDALEVLTDAGPEDMLRIQLDDRAVFLGRWRQLLLAELDAEAVAARAARADYRALAEDWIPRASVDSVGYRLVRGFRARVQQQVLSGLTAGLETTLPEGRRLLPSRQFEGTLWRLVSERPPHLLPAGYQTWRELLLAAVDAGLDYYQANYDTPLSERTWGEHNTVRIQHPLSRAVPLLATLLDMPREPLPGDANLPRAQGTRFGASERFAVAPGAEERGYFHMPTGQSGHPLSEWYDAGHRDWADGKPTPFLPGVAVHRLELVPSRP
ncbi:MAG: penicillin acylase family protein [Gammaproteobacteria bacterium]